MQPNVSEKWQPQKTSDDMLHGEPGFAAHRRSNVKPRAMRLWPLGALAVALRPAFRQPAIPQAKALFALAGKPVGLDEFMPECLAHVKELIDMVDSTYTDQQLGTVLKNECKRAHTYFPESSPKTGFGDEAKCKELAGKLHDARMEELESGSKDGYEQWCTEYYEMHAEAAGYTSTESTISSSEAGAPASASASSDSSDWGANATGSPT